MDIAPEAPPRPQVIHNHSAPGRNCQTLLTILNGRLQMMLDHIHSLEDRILQIEDGMSSGDQGTDEPPSVINTGSLRIDHAARRVFLGKREIPLSPTEYRLIYQLAVNSGKVVLHRDLLRRALPNGEASQGNLKVYIGRLRAKLNSVKGATCNLHSVRGVGYRLSA